MIRLIQSGKYTLIETKGQTKILTLDNTQTFAWVYVADIGEILIATHNPHISDHTLAIGAYRMYQVHNEPELVDLTHLELLVGEGVWQGYLLLTGLPTKGKKSNRIIPTKEIITKSIS